MSGSRSHYRWVPIYPLLHPVGWDVDDEFVQNLIRNPHTINEEGGSGCGLTGCNSSETGGRQYWFEHNGVGELTKTVSDRVKHEQYLAEHKISAAKADEKRSKAKSAARYNAKVAAITKRCQETEAEYQASEVQRKARELVAYGIPHSSIEELESIAARALADSTARANWIRKHGTSLLKTTGTYMWFAEGSKGHVMRIDSPNWLYERTRKDEILYRWVG